MCHKNGNIIHSHVATKVKNYTFVFWIPESFFFTLQKFFFFFFVNRGFPATVINRLFPRSPRHSTYSCDLTLARVASGTRTGDTVLGDFPSSTTSPRLLVSPQVPLCRSWSQPLSGICTPHACLFFSLHKVPFFFRAEVQRSPVISFMIHGAFSVYFKR